MSKKFKTVADRMNTCKDCGFTAFFMYKDHEHNPLCPKCNALEIKNYRELMADIQNSIDELDDEADLDLEDESLYEDSSELDF